MKKLTPSRWLAIALAASCTGCATGSASGPTSFFAGWSKPFAFLTADSKTPGKPPKEVDDELRRDNLVPPTAEFFIAAGALAESRGGNDAAIEQYKRAIKTEPNNVKAHLHLARLYDRLERFPEAEQAYNGAIAAAPNDPMPLNDFAMCLARQRRYAESIEIFSKAIALRPHETRLRNNIAEVLVKAGRSQEAFDHLRVVHSVAESHFNLALLLRRNGELGPARQQLVAALQVDPNFDAANDVLAELGGPAMTAGPRSAPRAASREVSAPSQLRAQAPREPDFDEDPADAPTFMPKRSNSNGGYYEGLNTEETDAAEPSEVLANRANAKKPKKSAAELRAKIEDAPAKIR